MIKRERGLNKQRERKVKRNTEGKKGKEIGKGRANNRQREKKNEM